MKKGSVVLTISMPLDAYETLKSLNPDILKSLEILDVKTVSTEIPIENPKKNKKLMRENENSSWEISLGKAIGTTLLVLLAGVWGIKSCIPHSSCTTYTFSTKLYNRGRALQNYEVKINQSPNFKPTDINGGFEIERIEVDKNKTNID